MKNLLPVMALALLPSIAWAGADDPVVMTVAGTDVCQSEFEYFLDKNRDATQPLSVREYADMYVDFKLKVQAAIDAGADTTASFREEYAEYRDMQAISFMLDSTFLEETARGSYDESLKEIGPEGLFYVGILSVSPKDGTPQEFERCNALVDSIHTLLENGGNFGELAQQYSTDNYARQGGEAGWFSLSQLPAQIAQVVASVQEGHFSAPFVNEGSPAIIYVPMRRQLGTYEDNRDDIYQWMESQPRIMQQAMKNKAMQYSQEFGWGIEDSDSAMLYMVDSLELYLPDLRNLSREYHDGLLLFESSNANVWDKALNDREGMQRYFDENRKKFRFEEPCFKGMVFFCKNEEVFHAIENAVRDLPIEEWSDTIVTFNHGEMVVRAMRGNQETGIFFKGKNAYVDSLVFGQGTCEPMKGLPYTAVIGHTLSEPESMNDVAAKVAQEYQDSLERQWVKSLRDRYDFKINRKVLKQIERGSSK